MNKIFVCTVLILLILGISFCKFATVDVEKKAHMPEEVTVTDLKKDVSDKQTGAATETKKEASQQAATTEDEKEKTQALKNALYERFLSRPKSFFNLFNRLFDDEDDLFGSSLFDDDFTSKFWRRRRPSLPSLMSSFFDDEDFFRPSLPFRREPSNMLSSFSKMIEEFKSRERTEWKETPEAFELKVKVPHGMTKDHLKIEIEKEDDEKHHFMIIKGKLEKHEEHKPDEKENASQGKIAEGSAAEKKESKEVAKGQESGSPSVHVQKKPYTKLDQFSEFERKYMLPESVDVHKITAKFQEEDHTLLVTLNKKPEAIKKKQKVDVKVH